jgi:hypothetical protein
MNEKCFGLHLEIGLPSVLNAGSSGSYEKVKIVFCNGNIALFHLKRTETKQKIFLLKF